MEERAKEIEEQNSESITANVIHASTVDEMLSKAGMSGIVQVAVHISVFMIILTCAYQNGLTFFQVYSPPWQCVSVTSSNFCNKHHNVTFSVDMEMFNERCRLNRSDWDYAVHHSKFSVVTELDLVCNKSTTATLIATLFFIGTMLGALLCGPVSDMYGRKTVIVLGLVLSLITSVLLGYVREIWQIYVFQMISGIAASSLVYPTYVYISEISPPEFRSIASSICVVMSISAFLLMDLMASILQNWRKLSEYMGLIGIPSLLCFILIPESPKWLFAKGQHAKAEEILSRINQFKGSTKIIIRQGPGECKKEVKYTYWHLVSNIQILRLTTGMVAIWSVLPVLYYTISAQSLNYGENMYINYMLATVPDIPATILAIYPLKKIGRKKTTLLSLCGSGIFIGAVALVPQSTMYRRATLLGLTVLSKVCCSVAFAGIYLWTPEVFPILLRTQAMAICATFEKVAMIAVPLLCTRLQSINFRLPFIVMGVLGVLGALAGCRLPETKNQPANDMQPEIISNSNTSNGGMELDNTSSIAI